MTPSDTSPEEASGGPERIAKRLARAGLCSRRDAERWIAEGRVAVNGTVLTTPAVVVGPGDTIVVDGKPLPEMEPTRLWRYHKPDGLVTSARDEKGRQTVFDTLPADLPRVVSVGRLDLTTEGLLLLTNDGELARFLELPSTGWARRYRVRVNGIADPARLAGLSRGVTIDGVQYGPIEALLDRQQGSNAWLTITLREGKNREVRNVMESLGLTVNRLIRVAYGPFQLGKLERGEVEEVPRRVLRDQVAKFFSDRGDEPVKPNTGTAKAKPQPKPHAKPRTPGAGPAKRPAPGRPAGNRPDSGGPAAGGGPRGRHETRRR
ncbi:rRNA pseudouridine synthase [Skermanella mucosa]|uniref:pseudouridine synthase n=1 Tax=Skermanella mucosa TaxID=1789672 RepID=UPI00192C6A00|nr:pseudouridine synthase [Skermanella mucosa]UEM22274.1 rRNA pseudouridine synthase [Skermanella mucosa]